MDSKLDRAKFGIVSEKFYQKNKIPITWDQYLSRRGSAYEEFVSWLLGRAYADFHWEWNNGRGGHG